MASYRSRVLTVARRNPEFDLGIARVEAGRLDDIICERIERQLNNTVASFSMAVDAWTDTEDGLKRLLEDAIRQIVSAPPHWCSMSLTETPSDRRSTIASLRSTVASKRG